MTFAGPTSLSCSTNLFMLQLFAACRATDDGRKAYAREEDPITGTIYGMDDLMHFAVAGVVILVCVGIAIFGVFRWRRIRRYRKEFRRQTTAVRGLRAQNSTHEMRNTNQSLPQGPVVGSQRPGASHAYQPVGQPEEADNHNRTTPTPRQSIEGDGNDGQTPPRYARE